MTPGRAHALQDTDLKVRKAALLVLNSVAHNKPAAVREQLPELMPMLCRDTKEGGAIHQVDLGPFKHVDDGLRKAAFECMMSSWITAQTASSPSLHRMPADGLRDDHDIKVS